MVTQDKWLNKVHEASDLRHNFLASEVRIAHLTIENAFKKHIDKNMIATHGTLLILIDEYPDSTQQQLSEMIGLQRSTMVRTIDEFEKKGWVKRHPKKTDRRSLSIRITPKGKRIVTRIKHKIIALEKHIEDTLGSQKRETLMKLLKEFQDALWNA